MKLIIEGIEVDTFRRDSEVYVPGGMICEIAPWQSSGCPLTMGICICPDGRILFRGWNWNGSANCYLHTRSKPSEVQVTEKMAETVAGLFSGRILVEGIRVPVGATVQEICPIDVAAEEMRIGRKIYLNRVISSQR